MTDAQIMAELLTFAHEKMVKNNAYPFCAFIVKNGNIIGRGYNSKVNDYGDRTMHGEMEAMKDACLKLKNGIYLENCTLYSTCEPCLACFDGALWSKIKNFIYCVDHTDFPDYFHDHDYSITHYMSEHPEAISFQTHILKNQGVELFNEAKKKYGW